MYDLVIWLAGIALEAIVIAVLLYRHIARLLPVFFLYSIWNLATDLSSRWFLNHYGYASPQYFRFFVIAIAAGTHWPARRVDTGACAMADVRGNPEGASRCP